MAQNGFKVGDKIRCIDSDNSNVEDLKVGQVYVVSGVDEHYAAIGTSAVYLEGMPGCRLSSCRFVLDDEADVPIIIIAPRQM